MNLTCKDCESYSKITEYAGFCNKKKLSTLPEHLCPCFISYKTDKKPRFCRVALSMDAMIKELTGESYNGRKGRDEYYFTPFKGFHEFFDKKEDAIARARVWLSEVEE